MYVVFLKNFVFVKKLQEKFKLLKFIQLEEDLENL